MDTARVKAMVENKAVDVDVLNIDATEAAVLARLGLLEPIDYGVVDRSNLLPEAAKEHYLLADVAAYVIAWSTRSFDAKSRPADWAAFFDAKAKPGQRSLWKMAPQTLEVAAMGGGQPREKLYPIDLDLAFRSLDAIKPNLSWWTSGAQAAQLLIDGEVDVGTCWNGRLFKPKNDGAPVDYTFDHALYVCDAMVVPKGAPNKKLAMEFLANMMDAKNQADLRERHPLRAGEQGGLRPPEPRAHGAPAQLAAEQRHGRAAGLRLLGGAGGGGVRPVQQVAARLSRRAGP